MDDKLEITYIGKIKYQ